MFRKRQVTGLLAILLTLSASVASAQFIDFLETPDLSPPSTGTALDFNAATIPADFFGPGSDPFFGVIQFVGEPLDKGQFGLSDTQVLRSADPFDRVDLPSPVGVQVDIEIVELSLKSADPIMVTFNGGQNPELWDVSMGLQGPQPPGQMLVIKTHPNGGIFDAMLPVVPVLVFTKESNPTQQQFLAPPQPFVFDFQNAPWVHDIDPHLGVFVPAGANFIPGIEETVPGDLNSQQRVPSTGQGIPVPGLPDATHTIVPPQGTGLPGASTMGLIALSLLLMGSALVFVMRLRRKEHAVVG